MFLHCLKFPRSALISFHYLFHTLSSKHSEITYSCAMFPHVFTFYWKHFLFLLQFNQSDCIRLVCISHWSLNLERFYQSVKGKLSILHIWLPSTLGSKYCAAVACLFLFLILYYEICERKILVLFAKKKKKIPSMKKTLNFYLLKEISNNWIQRKSTKFHQKYKSSRVCFCLFNEIEYF